MTHDETIRTLSPGQREALLEALLPSAASGQEEGIPRRTGDRQWAPLSCWQQRIWFLEQLTPGSSTYTSRQRSGCAAMCAPMSWREA